MTKRNDGYDWRNDKPGKTDQGRPKAVCWHCGQVIWGQVAYRRVRVGRGYARKPHHPGCGG